MELAAGFLFLALIAELAFHAYDRNQWATERRELTQRIQAPEQAVIEHGRSLVDQAQPVAPIALDDDEGYEALRLKREGSVPD